MRLVEAVDRQPTPWFWGINGAAGVLELTADRGDEKAAQVEERLSDLCDLPVQDSDDFRTAEQHVPVMEVAMDERGRALDRK